MSATELILFIALLVMMGMVIFVNELWFEECQKQNREWYEFCLGIIDSFTPNETEGSE